MNNVNEFRGTFSKLFYRYKNKVTKKIQWTTFKYNDIWIEINLDTDTIHIYKTTEK